MYINASDIEKISNLTGIEITKEEFCKYEKELATVLSWFKKLDKADTKKICDIYDDTLCTPLRKDEILPSKIEGEIVKAFPNLENNMAKVKKVI
ncbi:MAG: hypothetical protein HOF38_04735 [Elusimicrobiaceae bacterium]|jgi:aspartyl/glutamyl-tRNA(Asn/Gln) amidotransferase C subunit|nr:hypothetical protein [Elusimicrobiaceae bacterium]MBT3955442.1 hypothetical protein [Elusimicrobiaceae bacterium]MBT4008620.1 hypothetical protein [Elusimicrobiaceae bacterium]MBT4402501.1 hypothetical protein [Elusimicrobiaceae bacterium]MBT4439723.1 hypothetical protein [Elusimicrobiaceae bacterium]